MFDINFDVKKCRKRNFDEAISESNEKMSGIDEELEKEYQKLEDQKKKYEEWEKNLDKRQKENEIRRLQRQEEMAIQEQKTVAELLKLVEEQQREKDELCKQVCELEQKAKAEHAILELEIERLRGESLVMRQMQDREESDLKEKLKDKEEELEFQRSDYQAFITKYSGTNNELQDARKALIESMPTKRGRAYIGVKKMGDLNVKPFRNFAEEKYPEEANLKAAELCSLWDEHLRDPGWHPLKVITEDGNDKEILNEEDEKVQELKTKFGDEVFEAVIQALKEMNEYNGSGRYPVPELWNFRDGKKATLKEGVEYLIRLWKRNKRKPKLRHS